MLTAADLEEKPEKAFMIMSDFKIALTDKTIILDKFYNKYTKLMQNN